ncbi:MULTISPECIES: hypothetical protein [Paenibacillus]|uniref:hypothetical protein n=1 Tax=Paenibacillus TaxID=44249 RepID=UPI0022B89CA7|nr:hypothetical protein [Paenibacillus caseinilyticus]MCZ8523617.1 hypothetical protein [Paenibacillus caseinilyticus]
MTQLIAIAALCLMLAAGTAGRTEAPGGLPPAAPQPPATGAPVMPESGAGPAGEHLQEPVFSIRLNADPRLQAPIRTLVSPRTQTFTLTFPEAMDRASVEAALREHAEPSGTEPGTIPGEPVKVQLAYRWQSDRALGLEVQVLSGQPGDYPVYAYHVDANGAKTAADRELRELPVFKTVLERPYEVWRVPVSGAAAVRTGELAEPYSLQPLESGSRYAIATKTAGYCNCDATFAKHYSLYDLEQGVMTDVSFPLMASYQGPGDLYADPRGLFFGADAAAGELPGSSEAKRIQVGGYVHGSGWSKDRTKVLLAVSAAKEQEENLDLVVYDIVKNTPKRLPGVLKGRVDRSQVSDEVKIPVVFRDDGTEVRMALREAETFAEIPYRYSWSTGKVTRWQPPPVHDSYSSDYKESTDGRLRFYTTGEIFDRDGKKVWAPPMNRAGHWIPGTHQLVFAEGVETGTADQIQSHYELKTYDADTGRTSAPFAKLHSQASVLGLDAEGTGVYVMSPAAPEPMK